MLSKSRYSWLVIWLTIVLLSASCANKKKSVRTKDINKPLRVVYQAVEYALTGAIKKKSVNRRVYFSKYHQPGKDLAKRPGGKLKRAQVIISVLGGQRPYEVEVRYRIEKYEKGRFKLSRYDKRLAQKYLDLVDEYLASRRDGVDMIDGFRPY